MLAQRSRRALTTPLLCLHPHCVRTAAAAAAAFRLHNLIYLDNPYVFAYALLDSTAQPASRRCRVASRRAYTLNNLSSIVAIVVYRGASADVYCVLCVCASAVKASALGKMRSAERPLIQLDFVTMLWRKYAAHSAYFRRILCCRLHRRRHVGGGCFKVCVCAAHVL